MHSRSDNALPVRLTFAELDVTAFCNGRTLLPKTNLYLREIAPIADKNECVRHALLALAAGYILDYKPIPKLQDRANKHYKEAVRLVDVAIRDRNCREVGKDDAVIAALVLLLSNDVSITAPLHTSIPSRKAMC